MKSIGNLFEKIIDENNIREGIYKASRNRKDRRSVQKIQNNLDYVVKDIQKSLIEMTWKPNTIHKIRVINDGNSKKKREIICPDFYSEHIYHNIIFNVIGTELNKRFYPYSCSSIPNKGYHFAIRTLRKIVKDYKKSTYYTIVDVKKFFQSIDTDILMRKLEKKFREKKVVELLRRIVENNTYIMPSGEERTGGLLIGMYSSQWLANFYLTEIDYKIKELGATYYIRYNDDMIIFHSNKRKLKRTLESLREVLKEHKLEMKFIPQIHKLKNKPLKAIGIMIKYSKANKIYTITAQNKLFKRARRCILTSIKKIRNRTLNYHDIGRLYSYVGLLQYLDCKDFLNISWKHKLNIEDVVYLYKVTHKRRKQNA